jgi:hypothetical protein
LQEENAVLKMENAALKSTKRMLSIILAVVGAAIIFIAFGKQIIDFVTTLFKEGNSITRAKEDDTESGDLDLAKDKHEKIE